MFFNFCMQKMSLLENNVDVVLKLPGVWTVLLNLLSNDCVKRLLCFDNRVLITLYSPSQALGQILPLLPLEKNRTASSNGSPYLSRTLFLLINHIILHLTFWKREKNVLTIYMFIFTFRYYLLPCRRKAWKIIRYMCLCVCVCMYVCMYVCVYVYVCMYVCIIYVRMYVLCIYSF